jgi:hypothetical protein
MFFIMQFLLPTKRDMDDSINHRVPLPCVIFVAITELYTVGHILTSTASLRWPHSNQYSITSWATQVPVQHLFVFLQSSDFIIDGLQFWVWLLDSLLLMGLGNSNRL